MNNPSTSHIERIIFLWVQFIERNRIAIIFGILAFTIASVFYIKNNLGMSTDTTDMLSEKLHWRQLDSEYEKLFPQFLDNILVVVEADTPDRASDAAYRIYKSISADPENIKNIYYPALLPFFQQSAFLFLDTDELQDLADRLAMIQPFLGTLLNDQNLRGFFTMLAEIIQAKQDGDDIDIHPLLIEINKALENENYQVSWQRLMNPDEEVKSVYREFISLKVIEDNDSLLPGKDVIKHVRSIINSVGLDNTSIKVRLTGGTVLSYEELKSVSDANIHAIIISFILVAVILAIGLGSFRLVSASLITLFIGLIITTAFAAATVGELNLISVAFAVLYIGLGIDFAIHMTLRYREEKLSSANNSDALKKATSHIFRSLVLCAITTAIGFYSFLPTDYKGVAELGWIAGSGIFISLIVTFTLLPALLSFNKSKISISTLGNNNPLLLTLINVPYKYAKPVLFSTLILVIFLSLQINKISFDSNTLNLQDPENESVQTYQDLLADSDTSPWQGTLLEQNRDKAEKARHDLELLPLVDKVVWLDDFIPEDQEEKLFIIDEMNLLMGSLEISEDNPPIDTKDRLDVIKKLKGKLDNFNGDATDADIIKLKHNLDNLLEKFQNDPESGMLDKIEHQMLASFSGRIRSLSSALSAKAISLQDIPAEVYERWVSKDNHYRLQIYPKENLNDNAAMKHFVRELEDYDKNVIGSPVVSIEASDAVITAFKSAFSYAFISIAILLLLLVKVKSDAVIIMVSVIVGAVFTGGLMLFMNIPLNFANIIGLPLLLGIGVDSGIHITDRFRQEQGLQRNIFMTSSSRGVIVSSLTTICSIGNLAFSSHVGTASMGLLLAVGLASMMISTMMILPAFLVWQSKLKKQ